jgi:DNA-directed RNA polymerase subunit E'/Rpb7
MDKVNKLFYVEVEPMYMTSNIYNVILSKIKEKYINTCSEKNGYILDILKINHIDISGINDCSNNLFFKVDCEIQMLLPTIGKKLDCNIDMIFQHGIFSGFKNLKVLIPINTLENWEHDHSSNVFKKGDKKIQVNDPILVEITDIRYENCKYSCIGKLV